MSFFENPKLRYKKLLIILLPIFIVFLIMVFLSYSSILGSFGSNNPLSKNKAFDIETMDYHLRDNATEYQVELFKELNNAVKDEDEQRIVEGVAKNFIADVYTWTNKEDMWDVGGMCYVYSRYKTTNYFEMKDNLYQLMSQVKREYNPEDQVEVIGVEIESCQKNAELFEIEDKKYESYELECVVDLKGKENIIGSITRWQHLTIIKNTDMGGRYEVAATYGY